MFSSQPTAPLLAIDVGNTSTVLGLIGADDTVLHRWRVRTARDLLPDDLALTLSGLLGLVGAPTPAAAILSSVVPPLGQNLRAALEAHWRIPVLEVGASNLPEVRIDLEDPRAIGADRLVNLYGAQPYLEAGQYGIIVDFGTATTFDVVQAPLRFMGGVIAPGPATAADALFSRTAKLPRVLLEAPPQAVGRNTAEAIQSGLVFGYAEMVDGMVARLSRELPAAPRVIATGGFARTLEGHCRSVHVYDDDLTVRGLVRIWRAKEQR
ncbi:type III pantothenate kinase [Deinobacterium chartae]|uniref:Type III pantothenate kinase n=1 Tax=Deinobacterium chartae TaxID=521158 RepID=A0A841HZC2_9DEIO|nr:type III pantothenate kinase [Deinobacterium chartae]MBB6097559.1 type III pantothenate kinase [Deinobacterium chartae]